MTKLDLPWLSIIAIGDHINVTNPQNKRHKFFNYFAIILFPIHKIKVINIIKKSI